MSKYLDLFGKFFAYIVSQSDGRRDVKQGIVALICPEAAAQAAAMQKLPRGEEKTKVQFK